MAGAMATSSAAAPLAFLSPQQVGAFNAIVAAQQPSTIAVDASALSAVQSAQTSSTASPGAGAFASGMLAGLVGAGMSMRKGRSSKSAAKAFDPSKAVGAMPPTGYWDPCGCMKERKGMDGFEWKDEETFNRYRVAEIKHGRIAMIASVGLIANAFWKFPGFETVPDGLATLQNGQGGAGFGLLFILAGYFELKWPKGEYTDPLGLKKMCVDDDYVLQSKELSNCRMAMMAVVTLWIIEYGTGIAPSTQLFNLELESFVYPTLAAALVALPASGKLWAEASKDPAWPFKEPAAVAETKTISMEMPKTEEPKTEEVVEETEAVPAAAEA